MKGGLNCTNQREMKLIQLCGLDLDDCILIMPVQEFLYVDNIFSSETSIMVGTLH